MTHDQYLTIETMQNREGWRDGPEANAYTTTLSKLVNSLPFQPYNQSLCDIVDILIEEYIGPVNEIAFFIDRFSKVDGRTLNIS